MDKNPLAVEMGKLSLWLITLQKDRPFTFLDHALRSGDSLLGVTSADQLTHWSLDPEGNRDVPWFTLATERALDTALDLRRLLHSIQVRDIRDAETKGRLLHEAEEAMGLVRLGADLLIAAALRPARRREAISDLLLSEFHVQALAHEELREGALTEEGKAEVHQGFAELRAKADELLGGRRPFHWPLEFPEVFVKSEDPPIIDSRLPLDAGDLLAELSKPREKFVSGFAAIVGNPPFQGGQKITGSLGTDYRDYLVECLAGGKRGSADLAAYFFLRARDVTQNGGGMGLLATNTIAQGDSREDGIDQLTNDSCVITRAVPSRKWPGAANLEVAHLWLRRGDWAGLYILDDSPVTGITSLLARPGTVQGEPLRLVHNAGQAFKGQEVNGMGFILSVAEAQMLIEQNLRNQEVLFPFLNGEDLNSHPEQSPSRYVINFRDWSLEEAEQYPDCMAIIREDVKPVREQNADPKVRKFWWRFKRTAPELRAAIVGKSCSLVRSSVSNLNMLAFVPTDVVCSHATIVFAFEEYDVFGVLQSSFHTEWVTKYSSSMRTDIRYAPSDCFENFPFPSGVRGLQGIGERYYAHRQEIMQSRQEGLTKTYKRFHKPDEVAEDIERLRELHVEMDLAVTDAYGWGDLDLGHGFHETKQGVRFTISEETRREVLDRLLLLNHERYAEEVAQCLHDKKAKKGKTKKLGKKDEGGTSPLIGF